MGGDRSRRSDSQYPRNSGGDWRENRDHRGGEGKRLRARPGERCARACAARENAGVANLAEAHAVRALAPEQPVLLLSPALPEERADVVASGFVPLVSSVDEAAAYSALAHQAGTDPRETRYRNGTNWHLA
jgi:hypothetical protein